jgi:hypothetical protein
MKRVGVILREIEAEYREATRKFPDFHNAHEGYAVLLEEVDELWTEICRRKRNKEAMRSEAVQVAAMAVRFLADLCQPEEEKASAHEKENGVYHDTAVPDLR